jgi:hypothetical protein
MATFRFAGRVFPVFNDFTMIGSVSTHWEDEIEPAVKLIMDASVSINRGIIEVVCESNLSRSDNYDGQVDWRAGRLARSVVNSYAFAKAIYLEAILETVVKPDGIKYNIQARRPELEPLVTALHVGSDGGVDIKPLLLLALRDPTIFVALKDLVGSMDAHETLVNCARAVEGIRESMTPASDRKQAWQLMRDNLNVSQNFLEAITDHSKGPRHGDVSNVKFGAVHETIRRSWIVMNRFLEFKKRGDNKLPLLDFPLLDQ